MRNFGRGSSAKSTHYIVTRFRSLRDNRSSVDVL